MIISKIYGGVGNQIFMYAMGLSQARRLNVELKLDIDILIYNPFHYTPYDFELVHFNGMSEEIVTKSSLPVVNEGSSHQYKDYDVQDNHILDGYWQSEEFFESIKDELREKLIFRKESIKNLDQSIVEEIKNSNSVFIHARRGDYLNGDYFVDLSSTEYYQKAINIILEKVENPKFFIFSNDEIWARNYFAFINQDKSFLRNNTIEDLYLMSLCKNSIIANSSYSWWGTWLGNKEIIIQPKKWTKIRDLDNLKLKNSIVI